MGLATVSLAHEIEQNAVKGEAWEGSGFSLQAGVSHDPRTMIMKLLEEGSADKYIRHLFNA